ncbi:MAG: XRE family transcriptional regulator [Alphaproteobacteria bacterium]|nr:XRE family transcriptional regulator [Alphaproteobacteria bacterium]
MDKKFSMRGRTADGSPNPIDVHVGMKLKSRRILLGLSQEKLGQALGLTFQQIQKYEKGLNRIGASRLYDIANVLNISIQYFFEDISEEVGKLSPRNITDAEVPYALEEQTKMFKGNLFNKKETLELLRAYYSIENRTIAQKVLNLVKSLSANPEEDA